ncbi:23S rRNA (uracil(1939)-C(5))-methyltransferase RlmD [Candidatus Desantisbacteria bacterium]|nr:23S rRNA (uracil(1939)-C(5))-methyltransferase RlmD [Candidatus Desantisbacteria bacterium]
MIIFNGNNFNEQIAVYLAGRFREIKCLIKIGKPDSSKVFFGKDDFFYSVKSLTYKISSDNFWQVNSCQLNNMIEKVLDYAKLAGKENVLDAYCGVGFFSLFMAQKCKYVYGVEINSKSIENARINAKLNNISNIKFFNEDVEKVFINKSFKGLDLILLDPPRKGCSIKFLEGVLATLPKKIIYVSCDPATLARDLKILCADKYNIKEIQPIDMFPQTYHIESIVYMEIR